MLFKDVKLNEIDIIMTLVTGQKKKKGGGFKWCCKKNVLAITECSH